jgi:hypothetical protein
MNAFDVDHMGPHRGQLAPPTPRVVRAALMAVLTASSAVASLGICFGVDGVGITVASMNILAHVVVVVEENHSDAGIIGTTAAPHLNTLASNGAPMARSIAATHPGGSATWLYSPGSGSDWPQTNARPTPAPRPISVPNRSAPDTVSPASPRISPALAPTPAPRAGTRPG